MPDDFEVGPTGLRPADLRPWVAVAPSEMLFSHPYHASLVSDRVRLPDGREATWLRHADEREGISIPDAVGAVCERDDGKVLVSWQWNLGPQAVVAEFPGGGVHAGETFEQAAAREVAEEVGLRPRSLTLLGKHYYDNRRSPWMFRWFLAQDFEPSGARGDEVAIATAWLTPDQINQGIRQGEIQDQSMLAAWALYSAFKASR